jgi:phage-related protein
VRKEVFAMPPGIVADYVRLTDAMTLYGADLRMPHSFVKKTQETPDAELRLARKRLKDVQHG